MARRRKRPKFDVPAEVRAIARERVGAVPPGRPIEPKRRKPKHKKEELDE
ncbi:MAG: hypothetical protein M1436_03665 [Acidobacteria bacterium]|nr:hypothetical protein [Acidobacteriota bacterium]